MKCLDQQGLKYLWNLIKANFATSDEVSSECNAVRSALTTQISNHTGNTSNPHNVTKAQIGLGDFDYEEGEWTPTIFFPQQPSGATYTSKGYYRRVGDMVYISARYDISTGITSTYRSGGLPYTPSSDYTDIIGYIGFSQGLSSNTEVDGRSVIAKYFTEANTLFDTACCVVLANGWYKIEE